MYKYYLTYLTVKTEIDKEPIGWDGFATTLKRSNSHGISAEYSEMSLKFYCGPSITILRNAYNADVDSVVVFSVEKDSVEIYSGHIDFAEYKDSFDEYPFIDVKVSEIGVQATFNNRIEQKVNIDSLAAFDGAALPQYSNLNKSINLPYKEILLTSSSENKAPAEVTDGDFLAPANVLRTFHFRVDFAFEDLLFQELNDYFGIGPCAIMNGGLSTPDEHTYDDASAIYIKSEEDKISYQKYNIIFNLDCRLSINDSALGTITGKIMLQKGASREIVYESALQNITNNQLSFNILQSIELDTLDKLYLCAELSYVPPETHPVDFTYHATAWCNTGSYFKMSALSVVPNTSAKLSLIHETLSRITENISNNGINVKSDYYGRIDSEVNPTIADGPGSYKAINNGLRLRNALMSDNSIPLLSLSFTDMMKGLTPVDNIGYGISKENGILYLRIEPWHWFYKDSIVLEINNPAKISRNINPQEIFTRFKSGFKKFGSVEDVNSFDGFATDREYNTRVKLVDTLLEQISEFIADSYAIEYTRRLSLNRDTKDWKYDNDIFLFILKRSKGFIRIYTDDNLTEENIAFDRYDIDQGVTDSDETIISPETVYNARISPARNAYRWINRIFEYLKTIVPETLKFSAGTGNITAKFKPVSTASEVISTQGTNPVEIRSVDYQYHDFIDAIISENSNIQSDEVILKPETIVISEYPLTREQYNSIKDNPYGTIKVNGESCYLQIMTYKFETEMASLTLIPKFEL